MVIGVVVFGVYLVASRFVGSFYPLSTYDMYSQHVTDSLSRVVVLEAGGEAARLERYESFHCESPTLSFEQAIQECGVTRGVISYRVRSGQGYFDAHQASAPGSEAVRISVRTYELGERTSGRPSTRDCVIATCTAELRR